MASQDSLRNPIIVVLTISCTVVATLLAALITGSWSPGGSNPTSAQPPSLEITETQTPTEKPSENTTPLPEVVDEPVESPSEPAKINPSERGDPVPAETGTSISHPQPTMFLADMPDSKRLGTSVASVAGKSFAHPVYWGYSCGKYPKSEEWVLGREWKTFTADVGIRDDAKDGASARVEIAVDGTIVGTTNDFGRDTLVPIKVNVSGANRLTLTVVPLGPEYCGAPRNTAVFGDARVSR